MSKSLSGGLPGGAPSNAIHAPSGESVGRFAFCGVRKMCGDLNRQDASPRETAGARRFRRGSTRCSRCETRSARERRPRQRRARRSIMRESEPIRHSHRSLDSFVIQTCMPRGYARSGLQSPVSPSQQPTLKRHFGHCHVPCRHTIGAPQRRQTSAVSRWGSALIRANRNPRGGRLR